MDGIDPCSFMEAMPEACLLVELSGCIRYANASACGLFGYEQAVLLGLPVEDLMPERYRPNHIRLRQGFVHDKKPRRMGESKLLYARHASGKEIPVNISIGLLNTPTNGDHLFIITLVDRSEYLEIEEDLRACKKFYRGLFENAPLPYQSLDEGGHFVDVNQAWLELFGCRKDEVIGKFFGDFMWESSLPLLGVTFDNFNKEGFVSSQLFEAKRRDTDEKILITVSGRIERDSRGAFVRTHCILSDVTARVEAEQELERRANFDGLTGLSNRVHFFEMAGVEMARAQRYGNPLGLMLLDVDYFKQVNDRYGHDVGDAVITAVADTCLGNLREHDITGRMGGEEFAILLPETDGKKTLQIAERLRSAVSRLRLPVESGGAVSITVSIGVTNLAETDTVIESLLKRADIALYSAKDMGRNRVVDGLVESAAQST